MPYQAMVKLSENRNSAMAGPVGFATKEEREVYVNGPESIVFWYFYPEDDGWDWRRGGAWARTYKPTAADNVPEPPAITPDDRRW
jgi:hypothetical protein